MSRKILLTFNNRFDILITAINTLKFCFMLRILEITELIAALLLMIMILMQNRGAGLSETFGGEGNIYSTRRSVEKILFRLTIITAIIFFGSAISIVYLS